MADRPERRRVPRWMADGENPDYRFSLANERTFLAWIRTALALLAGAVALVQLVPNFHPRGARTLIGAVLAATGLAVAALAYVRWAANERAMRHGRGLPFTAVVPVLSAVVAIIGAGVALLAVFGSR